VLVERPSLTALAFLLLLWPEMLAGLEGRAPR